MVFAVVSTGVCYGTADVAVTHSAGVRVFDLGDAPLDFVERRSVAPEPDLVIRSGEDDISSVLADIRDVE